jgi:mevalonate kinase
MGYNNNIIQTLGVDDESTYGKKLAITVAVDTLDMCTISFGTSFSIRIPEDDVDALRQVLNTASVRLMNQRARKQMLKEELARLEEEEEEASNNVQL